MKLAKPKSYLFEMALTMNHCQNTTMKYQSLNPRIQWLGDGRSCSRQPLQGAAHSLFQAGLRFP